MTFCVRDDLDLIEYDIIPDNKFTENKTVVYDTWEQRKPQSIQWITSKNTRRFLKKNWQMIVFPGSEKAESSQAAD